MAHTKKTQLFLVATGFACFLAMNSFSLWGFSFLPQFAFGASAQDSWSTPVSLSNIVAFFVYFLGSTRFPRITSTIINNSLPPSSAGSGSRFITPRFADKKIVI